MEQNLKLSEKSKQVQGMFDKISNHYDLLNRLLSFRQDVRWRNALIQKLASPAVQGEGILCDVACGTGDVLYCAEKKRGDYKTFLGFDISAGMLKKATDRPEAQSSKAIFQQASAEELPLESNSVDSVTISFGLRNVDNRTRALEEFYRVLRPQGRVLVLEFFPAKSSILAFLFNFYFKKILPTIGGLISDKAAYTYLPNSVSTMPDTAEFMQGLEKIGFKKVEKKTWFSGAVCLVVGEK